MWHNVSGLQCDLDPVQRLIRDEERRQRLALDGNATSGPDSLDGVAAASAVVAAEAAVARRSAAGGESSEEEVRWRKTMNVIDTVLQQ